MYFANLCLWFRRKFTSSWVPLKIHDINAISWFLCKIAVCVFCKFLFFCRIFMCSFQILIKKLWSWFYNFFSYNGLLFCCKTVANIITNNFYGNSSTIIVNEFIFLFCELNLICAILRNSKDLFTNPENFYIIFFSHVLFLFTWY